MNVGVKFIPAGAQGIINQLAQWKKEVESATGEDAETLNFDSYSDYIASLKSELKSLIETNKEFANDATKADGAHAKLTAEDKKRNEERIAKIREIGKALNVNLEPEKIQNKLTK